MKIRLLHVSDLHASATEPRGQRKIAAAMLTDAARLAGESSIDLAVFSGDLAHAGTSEDLALAKELVLDPFATHLDLPPEKTVLVPGNHDVERGKIAKPAHLGLRALLTTAKPTEARTELASLFESDGADMDLDRLHAWTEFHRGYYAKSPTPPIHAGLLCRVHTIAAKGTSIGVVALNSSWRSEGGEVDRNNLVVGSQQLLQGLDEVASCDLKIVVSHHPLEWLVDWDANDLRRELEKRRLLVLTGHEHVPDPTAETSARGSAVYARAGCLYESAEYHNGYSIIDIDLQSGSVDIKLRTWWSGEHDRHEFGPAENIVEGGTLQLALGSSVSPAPAEVAGYTEIMGALNEVLDQRGLARHSEVQQLDVTERLVEPRFWPLPYGEVTALRVEGQEPEPSDPFSALIGSDVRVVLVAGDREAGVSSSLVWMLSRNFQLDASRHPAFIVFDRRLDRSRIEKGIRAELRRMGTVLAAKDELPQMIVAIDDVDVSDLKSMQRLAAFAEARPDWLFVIGSHNDDHQVAKAELESRGVGVESAYLGPLGRRELRQLVSTTVGQASGDLVDKILTVIVGQSLPRSPLIMSALVVVFADQPDTAVVNQSALLELYVGLFLGSNEAYDYERIGIDHRGRVHVLGWFASELTRRGVSGLNRLESEQQFASYFAARGMQSISPGRVLDDLLTRSVLREFEGLIEFRFPALLDLFKAKWMQEEEGREFLEDVLADATRHAAAIEHFSGLKRDSRGLLDKVGEVLRNACDAVNDAVNLDMFDSIRDRPGWSTDLPGIEELRTLKPPRARPQPTDLDLDDEFESFTAEIETREAEERQVAVVRGEPGLFEQLNLATTLLATVLRNSELVSDLELRRRMFVDVLRAWGLLSIVFAVNEDVSSNIADRIRPILAGVANSVEFSQDGEERDRALELGDGSQILAAEEPAVGEEAATESGDEDAKADALERQVEIVLAIMMSTELADHLGSPHIEQAAAAALDDSSFTDDVAPAMFATFLYCLLGFAGWPARLRALREQHGDHPIVARLTESYALMIYHRPRTPSSDLAALEQMLIDIYTSRGGVSRSSSGSRRVSARDSIRSKLRDSRSKHIRTLDSADSELEPFSGADEI